MKRLICVSLFCSACVMAESSDATLRPPQLGYIFEPGARTLRLLEGIPGASLAGPSLDAGVSLADALVPPDQSYVLALKTDTRAVCLLTFRSGSWTQQEIPGAIDAVDRFALSPSGSAAALYNASEGIAQIIDGLPDQPVVEGTLRLNNLERMAVSDDGTLLLVSLSHHVSPMMIFGKDRQGRAVPVAGPASAMSFRPHSHDAVIAANGSVTLVRDLDGESQYQQFTDTPAACVALAFSRQGDHVFAAYADGVIVNHDLTAGASETLDCHCVPTLLQRLTADSVFRLTDGDQGPILLLDGANHRVVFVARGDQ